MIILGIETSCDDTCAALLEIKRGKFNVLSNIISSQAKLHNKYGGVVPELAARQHIKNIIPVIEGALNPSPPQGGGRGRVENVKSSKQSSSHPPLTPPSGRGENPRIDAIAVTVGPGLITSLLVGVETAKALAFAWDKPLIGVNHIEGHIYSPLLPPVRRDAINRVSTILTYPTIALIVSGGHTELILMSARGGSASGGKNHGQYKLLGRTRDDAAGECFDKAAKMLGLGFPGGPLISKLAEKGDPTAYNLPRPMTETDNFEFSFSGLKNAIRLLNNSLASNSIRRQAGANYKILSDRFSNPRQKGVEYNSTPNKKLLSSDLAASIEQAIIDVLVHKSILAVRKYDPKSFILAGGVSANQKLRQTLQSRLPKSIQFLLPAQEYTQDNAAMIAAAGYFHYNKKDFSNPFKLTADANWELV